ncbi:nucleotide sugar dehydrogenase [Microbacterium sp. NE2HP2]|uniref:nucleotide sugar dehydrogenase n=1 Tax=Microbacterium plantarum TaxID=1816425 RepID=UPI0023651DA9|nr:nucleotide sugar dehydrogenase [Microbacterium plantarum]MDD7945813.1 nucleotide sugar dehydrogenase [Microbacterium plantarum]
MNETQELRIVVVGLGYVGVTAAACLSSQGHEVFGVDINEAKVAALNEGHSPIVEPGVAELVGAAVSRGKLQASSTLPDLDTYDLAIVCVGTPSAADGSHNMTFIAESARQIATAAARTSTPLTVAFRSTFRPGTMENLIEPIFLEAIGSNFAEQVELVYNPEFLRESTAVADYFAPPKIVVGTSQGRHSETMAILHDGIAAPIFETGFREAEITKFIDNSWHAVKVAFANEVGRVCAAYDVDASVAHEIFVSDTKLNISPYYTRPGGAFGGSCLPKDVRAMQSIARSAAVEAQLLNSLLETNASHKSFQLNRVLSSVNPGGRVLLVGLAFKAGTDDMRESPNVDLAAGLLERGYQVRIVDPFVRTSSLVGQNLGQVMTELPNLRSLLIDEKDVDNRDFDLIVLNSAPSNALELDAARVLDLRRIATSATDPTRTREHEA